MAEERTTVLYDVSQALKELTKLDKKVKKSGDTAEDSLGDKGSGGLKRFGDVAGRINPKVGQLSTSIQGFAGSGGIIATGFAAAGAAILSTIANITDLAGQLADIDARIDVINKTAERTLKLRNLASAIGDADENRRVFEAQRTLRLQQAESTFRQNAVERARDDAKRLVAIRKEQFTAIDRAFQESVRRRESAEERLRAKRQEGVTSTIFGSEPAGRQIGSLTARAQQEARRGNVDAAEALIDRAKQLSDELGNHVFFTDQIEKANKAVVRALEAEVKEARTQEGQLSEQRRELQGRVDDAQEFTSALDEQLKKILRQNRALAASRKIIRESAKLARDVQDVEEGQRRVETGVGQIREIAGSVGGQAFLGQVRDQLSQLFTTFKEGGTKISTVQGGRAAIDTIAQSVATSLDQAFQDGEITPREAQDLVERAAGFSKALAVLEKGVADNSLSEVLEQNINQLRSLFQGLENIGEGAKQARAGGVEFDQGIRSGALNVREEQQAIARERERQQQININIEGGMIDNQTIDQIAERIRRALRLETSRGTGN